MELAFLTSAVRRYFWIVVLGAVIGALPGLYMTLTADELYESRAVLLMAPPTQTRSTTGGSYQGDPDRYVAGEMSVLESLSDQVTEEVGGPDAMEGVEVTFEQQPLTDVVVVIAKAPNPELARDVADAYTDQYFVALGAQLERTQGPAIEDIEGELAAVKAALDDVDARIDTALRPYLGREAIPTVEQVAPALASEKETLSAQYNELQATRAELGSGLRVASRVVRDANLPTEPLASSGKLMVLVGAVAGGFLGLLAAVVVARLSRSVIDDDQAEEILGHDIVGTMPDWPEVVASRAAVLQPPTPQVEQFLDALGVRVEAVGQGTGTVSAVVCGVRSGAGTTTLATSLALQLASPEVSVLLVDADRHHPEVTELLSGGEGRADVEVVDTSVTNLQFVTLAGLTTLASSLSGDRRPNAELQLSVASTYADVVIIDGGALMGSASTVQLSRACDAVVVAVPRRQSIRGLETAAHELRSRDHLLPLWVPVDAKSASRHHDAADDGAEIPIEADVASSTSTSKGSKGSSTGRPAPTGGSGASNGGSSLPQRTKARQRS